MYVSAGDHEGQRRMSDHLELDLQAIVSHPMRCNCWELDSSPLREQYAVLTELTIFLKDFSDTITISIIY